jgi:hypothetical protein
LILYFTKILKNLWTTIKIYATVAIGKYLKYQNSRAEINVINTADIHWDRDDVAPLLIFTAVLKKTHDAGNHHISPDTIFANANHRVSFCWLNLVLVTLSHILADINVSNNHIIAITNHADIKVGQCLSKTSADHKFEM